MVASEVFKPVYWAYCTVPAILRMDLGLAADVISEARYRALPGNAEERLARWDLVSAPCEGVGEEGEVAEGDGEADEAWELEVLVLDG